MRKKAALLLSMLMLTIFVISATAALTSTRGVPKPVIEFISLILNWMAVKLDDTPPNIVTATLVVVDLDPNKDAIKGIKPQKLLLRTTKGLLFALESADPLSPSWKITLAPSDYPVEFSGTQGHRYKASVFYTNNAGQKSPIATATTRAIPEFDAPVLSSLSVSNAGLYINSEGALFTKMPTALVHVGNVSDATMDGIQMCYGTGEKCTAHWKPFSQADRVWPLRKGRQQMSVWLRDRWLNTSAPYTVYLTRDLTAPQGTVNYTLTASSVTLDWSHVTDAGSSVANYRLTSDAAGKNELHSGLDTVFTLNLAPNTRTVVYLFATDNVGNTRRFTIPISTKGTYVPSNVSAIAGNGSATILFKGIPGASNYTITAFTQGVPANIIGGGKKSPITIGGLVNGTEYTFTVTANKASNTYVSAMSNAVTPTGPPAPSPHVDGFAQGTIVIGDMKFVVEMLADYSGRIHVVTFDKNNTSNNEVELVSTTGLNQYVGYTVIGNVLIIACNRTMENTGTVYAIDVTTGNRMPDVEKMLPAFSTICGIAADPASNVLYVCYSRNAFTSIVAIDILTGVTIGTITDSPGDSSFGSFATGIMTVGDALYFTGYAMLDKSYNRIKVFKIAKDLSALLGSVQYRAFTDSQCTDAAYSATFSPDNSHLVVSGAVDSLCSPINDLAKPTLLTIDTLNMSITSASGIPELAQEIVYDSSGNLYCILGHTGSQDLAKIDSELNTTTLKPGVQHVTLFGPTSSLYATIVSPGAIKGSDILILDFNGNPQSK